jgi:hypothetical protein
MPYSVINGSNAYNRAGLWSQPAFTCPVYLPQTRAGHRGNRPIRVSAIGGFFSGRGNTATVTGWIDGSHMGNVGVPNSGFNVSANYALFSGGTGYNSISSNKYVSARFSGNGRAIWMVYRNFSGLSIVNDSPYFWYNKSMVGGFDYIEVPSEPRSISFSGITSSSFKVSWSGPADNGGAGVSGYYVQISKFSNFSSIAAAQDTSAGSHIFKNLDPGTQYYVRVFAKNVLHGLLGEGSPWSAVATTKTIINPPDWDGPGADKVLGALVQVGTPYSDAVIAYTQVAPVTYSVSSGVLPLGLTLNAATGQISGTPTLAAIQSGPTYNFSITATNAGGKSTISFSRTVLPETSIWNDNVISLDFRVGLQYSDYVNASGTGVEYSNIPLVFGETNRPDAYELIPGIFLDRNTGDISGTPTSPGQYSFIIYATNDSAESNPLGVVLQAFTVTVKPSGKRFTTKVDSEYVSNIKRWSGNEWVDITNIRRWDGSRWIPLTME